MVVDLLASRHGIDVRKIKNRSLTGEGRIAGEKVLLAKPQTFMNLSGEAVKPLFSYLDMDVEDVIVVHDDLDLDFGRIRIKSGGGHGGHNGIRSILSCLGNGDFTRVRIGIGKPPKGYDVSSYVLSPFPGEEKAALDDLVGRSADAVEAIIDEGLLKAMNDFN